MTLKELSQLYILNREIEIETERLERLKSSAYGVGAAKADGMPHGSEPSRTTEVKAVSISNLEQIIAGKVERARQEKERLEQYIASIDDSLTRQIYTLRFAECMSWEQVAVKIGGNTADSVKKVCYRYLRSHP